MLPNIFKTFGLITIAGILVLVFHHLGLNELLNVLITSIAVGALLRYFIGKWLFAYNSCRLRRSVVLLQRI